MKLVYSSLLKAIFPFLLLCGCSPPLPWHYQEIEAFTCQGLFSRRLFFCSENQLEPVEFEIRRNCNGMRGYLNLFSGDFPVEEGTDCRTELTVTTSEGSFSFYAFRFEGGQKLSLSTECTQLIVNGLLRGEDVQIEIQGLDFDLHAASFKEQWRKFS